MFRRFMLRVLLFLLMYFILINLYLWNQHCQQHPTATECQRRSHSKDFDIAFVNSKKIHQKKVFEITIDARRASQNLHYLSTVLQTQYQGTLTCDRQMIIVLVSSKVDNVDQRKAIRKTWASKVPSNINIVFVTGKVASQSWSWEYSKSQLMNTLGHGDIGSVIAGNFIDDERFYTSTTKYLFGFKWVLNNCQDVKLIMCVEDTMFVNLSLTNEIIAPLVKQDANLGKLWIGTKVENQPAFHLNEVLEWFGSNRRYYVPKKVWSDSYLPPFCALDVGFILSWEAIKHIYTWSWNNSIVPFPDVHFGISAFGDNWNITQLPRVTSKFMNGNLCTWRRNVITNEFNTPDLFYKAWGDSKDDYVFQLNCHDPNVETLLPRDVSNKNYFDTTLAILHDIRHTCLDENGLLTNNMFLIMLISSHPNHFEARQAIRATWGNNNGFILNKKVRLRFIIGQQTDFSQTYQKKLEIQSKIHKEYFLYQDIIQANFSESHRNLTLKVVLGLKWVSSNCPNTKFVFKGDDDVFVNVEALVRYLSSLGNLTGLYLGSINNGFVVRDETSKYFVPESMYPATFYPPFMSGGGYVLSGDIILQLYQTSISTYLLPLDDVYQGILTKRVGVKPTNHKYFRNAGGSKNVCLLRNSTFTLHRFDANELLKMWSDFKSKSYRCV